MACKLACPAYQQANIVVHSICHWRSVWLCESICLASQAVASVLAIYPDSMVDLLRQLEVLKDAGETRSLFDVTKLAAGGAQHQAVEAYLAASGKASADHIKNLRALYLFNILKSIGQMSYCSVSFSSAAPAMRPYVPAVVAGPVVAKACERLLEACAVQPVKGKLNPLVELQELLLLKFEMRPHPARHKRHTQTHMLMLATSWACWYCSFD